MLQAIRPKRPYRFNVLKVLRKRMRKRFEAFPGVECFMDGQYSKCLKHSLRIPGFA